MPIEKFIQEKEEKEQFSFRITKSLKRFVDTRCSKLKCKSSDYVRALIMQDRQDQEGGK